MATAAALTVVAAAYWLPDGKLAEIADVITPLTGHILVGGSAALAALMVRRRAFAIVIAGGLAALAVHPLVTLGLRRGPVWPATEDAAPRDRLRVYALNSWDRNLDIPRLERALLAANADVMVLTEVDRQKMAILERLKSRYPHQVSCAHQPWCATAILSRLPIIEGQAGRQQEIIPPIAWARIDARSIGLGTVTVVGTHVHRPTRGWWLHARQMRTLTDLIGSAKGPLIVGGDFNTGPWSVSYRRLLRQTGMVDSTGLMPTWPAYPIAVPQVALDHILVSPDLKVFGSGVGAATGSDHLPVVAEIVARAAVRAEAAR